MKTNVYFNGFNFYYGMFQGNRKLPWKWADLLALSQRLMPGHTINRIRYFTADVSPTPQDPDKAVRQQTYLRALETLPGLTVHKGAFLTNIRDRRPRHPIPMPIVNPSLSLHEEAVSRRVLNALSRVQITHTEEKGSDVNLATFLLLDAFDQDCEAAVIISNDSDLALPVQIVRDRFQFSITIFNPHSGDSTRRLQQAATRCRRLRPIALRESQFPDPVIDRSGRAIYKPKKWAAEEAAYLRRNSPNP